MPMPCYLTLEGQTQGNIEGSVDIQGHEGKILIQAVEHTIEIPKSPQTGLPTGKRIHGPMTLTKEIDKSSPKLSQALASGEQMKSVALEFYRILKEGKEEHYYTVKLENAILTSIRSWTPNCLVLDNKQLGHMEDVSFTYEKITWTYVPDGIEAEDSWRAPKV
ncbi:MULTISPECIES: Hcp family type VI secretion system effector [Burkholderia]|uniref:Hcp family type VI secretion system effector n=1 Tax=Burkholderia TaxID=32008 RepID=UPI00075AFFE4|nr:MULTISPECIES: Hcp family type VI secretion system effector [Burkholderia]AOJ73472.1 type VI secretion protein [Burkholderia savannae]KVG41386.1 type VI secretion protein [Burkholderia sp. MSMB0265]KVG87905.1 type VI secretion protein [Burkholderia sp. MSMB2040]KVG96476.1 type VI secretion protein [Burkholderia sp. MSMB2041]KVH01623.1 type VI secretion protein [Burkholderia sp. MSMB2042]